MVQALLATLLMERGRKVSRERLLQMLWDDPPRSAEANLRQYIAKLREQLRLPGIDLSARIGTFRGVGAYALHVASSELDLAVHEDLLHKARIREKRGDLRGAQALLTQALAFWDGPIVAGTYGSGQLRRRLSSLNDLRYDVLQESLELRLALEPAAHVIPDVRTFVLENPLHERRHGLLMRAYCAAGDNVAALKCYEDARTTMIEEMGVEPGPDLQRLHLAILRRDPQEMQGYFVRA
ncbi:BTAD domain-containing putative transcriptional regulator [Microbispora bryophytorum]|uniref:AfsR/SARP family transcriptional regulator n=1 Tax=Microbispora bryophytorum TaxID=1460882 RepID=UPI003720AB07